MLGMALRLSIQRRTAVTQRGAKGLKNLVPAIGRFRHIRHLQDSYICRIDAAVATMHLPHRIAPGHHGNWAGD